MKTNIKFNYLYRDGANYKNLKSIIFNNPENITLSTVQNLIQAKLMGGEYFYANDWQVPDLHFSTWDNELDHTFHEFESVEYTDELADEGADIALFINILQTVVNPS
ncbi:hypothetical protein ACEN9X_12165 [Mucilaginibacter sp. Mucisp86]|uniref:hypothetical protein n=1 Tax=Mucilaginibacter sp. Mucisp86 TaxID=3243060 RepID=UPI0039B67AAF